MVRVGKGRAAVSVVAFVGLLGLIGSYWLPTWIPGRQGEYLADVAVNVAAALVLVPFIFLMERTLEARLLSGLQRQSRQGFTATLDAVRGIDHDVRFEEVRTILGDVSLFNIPFVVTPVPGGKLQVQWSTNPTMSNGRAGVLVYVHAIGDTSKPLATAYWLTGDTGRDLLGSLQQEMARNGNAFDGQSLALGIFRNFRSAIEAVLYPSNATWDTWGHGTSPPHWKAIRLSGALAAVVSTAVCFEELKSRRAIDSAPPGPDPFSAFT